LGGREDERPSAGLSAAASIVFSGVDVADDDGEEDGNGPDVSGIMDRERESH